MEDKETVSYLKQACVNSAMTASLVGEAMKSIKGQLIESVSQRIDWLQLLIKYTNKSEMKRRYQKELMQLKNHFKY